MSIMESHLIKKEDELFSDNQETQRIIETLFSKQQEYYEPNQKKIKRKEVENELKKIFEIALNNQLSKKQFKKYQNQELDKNISNIKNDLINMSKTYVTRNFFFWKLYFAGVFLKKKWF